MNSNVELALDSQTTPRDRGQAESGEGNAEHNRDSLDPVDGGRAAWKLLLAAFVFESLLWGK